MATSVAFKDFVLENLEQCSREYLNARFDFSARKMFGEYCVYIIDSACSDFLGSVSDASLQRTRSAPHSLTSHNPKNSSTILESHNNSTNLFAPKADLGGKKVLFLLCDEQVFIKKYEALEQIAQDFSAYFSLGFPFSGAREHYIIDIENLELLATIIESTLPYLPVPKVKKYKKLSNE